MHDAAIGGQHDLESLKESIHTGIFNTLLNSQTDMGNGELPIKNDSRKADANYTFRIESSQYLYNQTFLQGGQSATPEQIHFKDNEQDALPRSPSMEIPKGDFTAYGG